MRKMGMPPREFPFTLNLQNSSIPFVSDFVEAIAQLIIPHLGDSNESVSTLTERLQQPPETSMGHYALPCFLLAKTFKKSPQTIALGLSQSLAADIEHQPLVQRVSAQGAYLNFWVDMAQMAQHAVASILDGSMFTVASPSTPHCVMVEYSQPNTHKGFHVGHMRNVALGDALSRLLAYQGNSVIAANYIGDVGAHIARCLWMMQRREQLAPQLPAIPPPSTDPHLRGEWLGKVYTAATQYLEQTSPPEKERCQAEINQILRELETHQAPYYPIWQDTRQWSLDAFNEIYHWLGAHFDVVFYESEIEASGREKVLQLLEAKKLIRSQGAVGINLDDIFPDKKLGFFLLLKADGSTLYATKDLALAELKFQRFHIQRSIYVVGAEQSLYFQQLFATLEHLGWEQARQCEHLSYGLVTLPQGKMSSRAGNVILFSKLREEMNNYIHTHYLHARQGKWSAKEIQEACRRIACAAIRYQMVKQDPDKPLVFSLQSWLVSEGDTGVYLCYAAARLNSLLQQAKKHRISPSPQADFHSLQHPIEHTLVRQLYDFNSMAHKAAQQLRPNLLANALFQLAKDFHRFYASLPIIQAPPPTQLARLTLAAAVQKTLLHGLQLLGITPPQRM